MPDVTPMPLLSEVGLGLRADGAGDIHVRSALSAEGVEMRILSRCPLGRKPVKSGDRLHGEYLMQLEGK